MDGWQDKLKAERAELDGKRLKLERFIGSAEFKRIATKQRHLLRQQSAAMKLYSSILSQRIDDAKAH